MPELSFEVYCGICGAGCCNDTTVKGHTVTVECRDCLRELEQRQNEIDELERKIEYLEQQINDYEEG